MENACVRPCTDTIDDFCKRKNNFPAHYSSSVNTAFSTNHFNEFYAPLTEMYTLPSTPVAYSQCLNCEKIAGDYTVRWSETDQICNVNRMYIVYS